MCRITRGHAHEETQKLQPSISFLVVSGRARKTQATNYREFPVAQWKHQLKKAHMKPRQCNEPKNPWPRARNFSHRSCCLWPLAPQRCAGNVASTQPSVPSCLGNANTGSFRTNEACNTCNKSRSRKADIHRRVHHEAHLACIDHMSNRHLTGKGPVDAHWGTHPQPWRHCNGIPGRCRPGQLSKWDRPLGSKPVEARLKRP